MARKIPSTGRRGRPNPGARSNIRGWALFATSVAVITLWVSRLFPPRSPLAAPQSSRRPAPQGWSPTPKPPTRVSAEADTIVPPAGYERADVGPRFIVGAFALLLGSLALVVLCVLWLFPFSTTDRTLNAPLSGYPEPRLQASPRQEMERFSAEERAQLTTYGWVDKQHGIVRIPVDVAMDEIERRGIPDWPTPSRGYSESSRPTAATESMR
jgi:hypothetical protein